MKSKQIESDIRDYLNSTFGEVKPEWELIISLLLDNINLYKECKVILKKEGLFNSTTYKKNPLIATIKDLQASMIKQIQHLGLSPYAASKIKEDIEDTDNFIEDLTNG